MFSKKSNNIRGRLAHQTSVINTVVTIILKEVSKFSDRGYKKPCMEMTLVSRSSNVTPVTKASMTKEICEGTNERNMRWYASHVQSVT